MYIYVIKLIKIGQNTLYKYKLINYKQINRLINYKQINK